MPPNKVHIIINPASGRDEPILSVLNTVFSDAGWTWDMTLTEEDGDTSALARQIAESGVDVLAAYGGDDTLTAAAAGLHGLDTPLAVLPGGTANVLALELGIPIDIEKAARLIVEGGQLRCMDLGRVGDRYFSVRVSTGLLATMLIDANRDIKKRLGEFAYTLRGLEAVLGERQNSHYEVVVDGLTVETEGVASFIANSGNLSLPGVSFSPDVRVDDGLLDLLVIRRVDVQTLISVVASAAQIGDIRNNLQYWQGEQITVRADPPHPTAIDGEELGQTPVTAEIVPAALNVIVPGATEQQSRGAARE